MRLKNLDLDFVKPKKTDLPGPPRAHVYVKRYSTDNWFITLDCVSLREFEYEISRLHEELDKILKQAKREFLAYDVEQKEKKGRL